MPLRHRWLMPIYAALILVFCNAVHAQAEDAAPSADRPNIIVFLVDDMGWTDTSVPFHTETTDLNRRYHTPHMARLASRGVMFTQAYASAVCSPSRVSLMTGMNAVRHGVTNWTLHKDRSPDRAHPRVEPPAWPLNGLAPSPGTERTAVADCLPQLLSDAGYRTIHAGKAHFGAVDTPGADPLNLGFDVNIAGHAAGGPGSYLGTNNFSAAFRNGSRVWDVPDLEQYHGQDIYLTEAITREAIKAMNDSVEDDKPFYLYMSHYAIHAPWEADPRYLPHYQQQGLGGMPAAYASMIESMDKSLGDLLDWLAERDLDENTLVVFLSDNGAPAQAPRNLPLRGCKLRPYEGGTRVPMIVRWPGHAAPGTRSAVPVIIEDLFPSVLEAAGVEPGALQQTVDGVSFLPLLDGDGSGGEPRELLWHFPHTYDGPPWSAIRIGDWKLIWFYDGQKAELYNLREDLGESVNLAQTHPDKLAELSAVLVRQLAGRGALIPIDKTTNEPFGLPAIHERADADLPKPTALADEWELIGEAINEPGYHVWGSSPILDDDGRVHLFAARWPIAARFDPGWRTASQIAHYVADQPEGPFTFVEVVLAGDGEGWDAQGIHNPNIQRIGDRLALTFIANDARGRHGPNQRLGMVIADGLDGPWRPANGNADAPLLAPPDDENIWCHASGCGVNNPALIAHPDGRFFLYFKAKRGQDGPTRMGLAIADRLEGPYTIQPDPITDNDRTIEDGYAFQWRGHLCLITTDNHGILENGGGLLWVSENGQNFDDGPLPGFHHLGNYYFQDGVPNNARVHYTRQVKVERPQVLMIDGEPAYLYAPCGVALDGSDGTNSYVFRRIPVNGDGAAGSDVIEPGDTLDLASSIQPLDDTNFFRDPDWHHWGASVLQAEDGAWHMFYARWPRHGGAEQGFSDWLWTSEIAHATADTLGGPWTHVGTVLEPGRAGHWDSLTAHNPRIRAIDGRFYLYYISHGEFEALPQPADRTRRHTNWGVARNSQFSGVAVADTIQGPYVRQDAPLLVGDGPLVRLAVNPTLIARPDGQYQLIVKGDNPNGGHRIYGQALADSPTGPFTWHEDIIATGFNTEDPDAWYDARRERYYALVTRAGNPDGDALALITSEDGLDWRLSDHPSVLGHGLPLADGGQLRGSRIERPSIIRDREGRVVGMTATMRSAQGRDWATSSTIIMPFE